MAQVNLTTTTTLTKYLRAKTTPGSQIVSVSKDLLRDELPVYFPNKEKFLLELIVDRLNDSKFPYSEFRGNVDLWKLYLDICEILQNNQQGIIRSTFQGFRFIECLYSVLQNCQNLELVKSLTNVMKFIRGEGLLSLGTSQFDLPILILTEYLKILNNFEFIENNLILEIIKFYKTLTTIDTSKKFQDQFINLAIPQILKTLTKLSSNPLESLIKSFIIAYDDDPLVITEKLIKLELCSDSLVTFFKLLSTSNTESSFLAIVKAHPDTIHELLKHSLAKSLSLEFLTEVYHDEMDKKIINWDLILTLIRLDVEIAISNTEEILLRLDKGKVFQLNEICEELIKAYIKIRSFPTFYLLSSKLSLKFTSQPFFLALLTSHVKELTPLEIKSCIELNDYGSLNALIQGFFQITDQVTLSKSRDLFISILQIEEKDEKNLSFAKFQILCLYEDLLNEEELLKLVESTTESIIINNNNNIDNFFLIFRIRELLNFDCNKVIDLFMNFFFEDSKSLSLIWKRWFVFIDQIFNSKQISQLIELTKKFELIQEILSNEIIFECNNIMIILIEKLSLSVKDYEIQVLVKIPIECYPRKLKPQLIDKLIESNIIKDIITINLIKHILQTPTFKSLIESDPKKLIQFIENFKDIDLNFEIFQIIINHHFINIKELISLKFLLNLIEILQKKIMMKNGKSKEIIHQMAYYIIIKETTNLNQEIILSINNLNKILLISIEEICHQNLESSSLIWILDILSNTNLEIEYYENLKLLLIQKFSNNNNKSLEINGKLFNFLTMNIKHEKNEINLNYYLALFITLRKNFQCSSIELIYGMKHLLSYILNTDQQKFFQGLDCVLYTMITTNDQVMLELCMTFVSCLSKNFKESSIKYFVKILNIILSQINNLNVTTDLENLIKNLQLVLTTQSFLITQFSLELILTILSSICSIKITEELFESSCMVISLILSLQRYRLSSRNHTLISLLTRYLKTLSQSPLLRESKLAGMSMQRLFTNFCEISSSSQIDTSELHNTQMKLKSQIRSSLPPLLLTYIHCQLKSPFPPQMTVLLLPGIYTILDVLSQDELILINTSIDSGARAYFRVLIDGYKDMGKWRG